ncbi:MAG TPA: SUMF1/EgtB/PvdO family nonheme iron enzyme [Planctomycetota bacterium]
MRMPASAASVLAIPLVTALAPLVAQGPTGRTMSLAAPVVLGHTASLAMSHPAAAAGNVYAFLWSAPPFAGVTQIAVPGFTVQGLARVDLAGSVMAFLGVLGTSGSVAHGLAVPNDPNLIGYAWDLQGVDLEFATATLSFADNELTLRVAGNIPSNMVAIAPGSFLMGSSATAGAPHFSQAHERPVHTVTISRPFWIGRYEVTQAEYQAVTLNNPSLFQHPQRPVETVMWTDAMVYCGMLTAQEAAAGRLPTGYCYRLPTEAEWEYCCRAGTTSEYHTGDSLTCAQASFGYLTCSSVSTAVTGSYPPNAWGLHDMHGNVWEICLDSWDATVNYPTTSVVDPVVSTGPYRVFRGGGYGDAANWCRSAVRTCSVPFYSTGDLGFRVVLAPVLP